MTKKKKKYYTVWKGHHTGIFESWDDCKAQIKDFQGAQYKSFTTFEAAKKVYQWMGVEDHIKMHWRTGGHDQGMIDWVALLDFSDQYFFDKKVDSNFDINPYPTIKIPVFWKVPDEAIEADIK